MNGRWITTWRNKGVLLLLFSSLLLLTATLRADWDFVTINQRTEQLYGPATPEARKRINEWQALLGSLPGSGGSNKRVGDSKRLSRWQDVLTKMRAEGFSLEE